VEGRGIALILGYVPKIRLISTVACQRNLSLRIAGLQAEIVMHEFTYKITVCYVFAIKMATAVYAEKLELRKYVMR
jgi:hypothetical protein